MKMKHDVAAVLTSNWIKNSKTLYNSVDISFMGIFSIQNKLKKEFKGELDFCFMNIKTSYKAQICPKNTKVSLLFMTSFT